MFIIFLIKKITIFYNLTRSREKLKIGSEKNFGIVFSIFFFLLTIYLYFFHGYFNIYTITISFLFFIISFSIPLLFKYPNIIWFYFGIILGKIVVPIFLLLTYFIIITPMGFLVRLFKRNYIDKKIDNNLSSYWIKRNTKLGSFDDQF